MGRPVGLMPYRPSDRTPVRPTRRWRLASPGSNLRGCPLRQDTDETGAKHQVACADLQGTMEACKGCKR